MHCVSFCLKKEKCVHEKSPSEKRRRAGPWFLAAAEASQALLITIAGIRKKTRRHLERQHELQAFGTRGGNCRGLGERRQR